MKYYYTGIYTLRGYLTGSREFVSVNVDIDPCTSLKSARENAKMKAKQKGYNFYICRRGGYHMLTLSRV